MGINAFAEAFRYPFKNWIGLLAISSFYGFLLLGGFRTWIMAYALLFGSLSLVIKQVAWGRTHKSFLPDFGDFSLGRDVFSPLVLGIGTTVVTFGPLITLVLAIWSGWLGNSPSPLDPLSPSATQAQQSSQLTAEDLNAVINSEDSKKDEEVMKKLEQLHPKGQARAMVETHEEKADNEVMIQFVLHLMQSTGVIVPLALLCLLWATFYYPMALVVAGYSEDFWSVINPMVGLDTIRRMGIVYVKAFFMYLGVEFVGIVLILLAGILTAPLALPLMGNLPGRIVEGVITFYCSLVVAFTLGLALNQCADKLSIPTD